MSIEQTPPLSREGWEEVRREMTNPPEATPERMATFEEIRELKSEGRARLKPSKTILRR